VPRLPAFFGSEEQQYGPFIAAAIFFGLVVGFPLGTTLAHAAAQGSNLGGRWPALAQVHGHLQLLGWVGLFVVGMGYRLVPRFTAVKVRPAMLVPLTLALIALGLALRAIAQPFADEGAPAVVWVASAALEALGAALFAGSVLRCLLLGRRDEFLYTPFFASGAVWLALALALNLVFVADAAADGRLALPPPQSSAVVSATMYGFALMFVLGVSLRTFPIFFERPPAPRRPALAVWGLANAGLAAYVAALVWQSYDHSADLRLLNTGAYLATGAALVVLVGLLRIFEGRPHRLRAAARRSMVFVRWAYGWLLLAAGLQVFFAARALVDERLPTHYETDAVRHFLAVGFLTMMMVGMALLVMPRLAMRRAVAGAGRTVALVLLVLINAAAAARGAAALLENEMKIETGFWTSSVAGVLAILAGAVFAAHLLRTPPQPEIPLAAGAVEGDEQ